MVTGSATVMTRSLTHEVEAGVGVHEGADEWVTAPLDLPVKRDVLIGTSWGGGQAGSAQTPMVSAAVYPVATEPDIDAIWWMPPSSPKTMSEVSDVCCRLLTLCS